MDFKVKNFQYVARKFGVFVEEASNGGKLYLRSLSTAEPTNLPANLNDDFPAIAKDFKIPPELDYVSNNRFSSVLRISGPVNMWLHYDIMANIYTQIRGSKRLVLFPPSDVTHLGFEPGASSSSVDVFSLLGSNSPALWLTHPHEAVVQRGDVLFLPPLWLHTATPGRGLSVAVNVFFRDMEAGYSSGRDVYGNRDMAAYERGRLDVARIAGHFKGLPDDVRGFYLRRLADELVRSIRE
jgi:tRNA wybutosine-synthesizing protein 4